MADINNLITLGIGASSSIEYLILFGLNGVEATPVDAIVFVDFLEDDLSVTFSTEKMIYQPVSLTYILTDGSSTLTDGTNTLTAGVSVPQNIYVVQFQADDCRLIFEDN